MTDIMPAYPSPHADDLSAPYWEGTKRDTLVVQRCADCGKLRHYPQVLCTDCYSDHYDWVDTTGRGTVHSWTVSHHAFHLAFGHELPYALVTVDLEEGIRAMGRLDGLNFADLSIGLALRASFPRRSDGFGQLTFVPA
ncbi:MAG: OB-fold domain-containing protein [Paracoccaceae bacterium]